MIISNTDQKSNFTMCNHCFLYVKRHGGYRMLSRSGDVSCILSCDWITLETVPF
jgi:hypothetical protein